MRSNYPLIPAEAGTQGAARASSRTVSHRKPTVLSRLGVPTLKDQSQLTLDRDVTRDDLCRLRVHFPQNRLKPFNRGNCLRGVRIPFHIFVLTNSAPACIAGPQSVALVGGFIPALAG
jgi:hypothetical protein